MQADKNHPIGTRSRRRGDSIAILPKENRVKHVCNAVNGVRYKNRTISEKAIRNVSRTIGAAMRDAGFSARVQPL